MSATGQDVWPTKESGRELLRLAWPLILGNSFWTLQIVLDRVLLSQSSSREVGAALSAAMIFWAFLTLFQYTANYATTFVAQYTGAGQPQRVGAVVGQALWFSIVAGLAFLLLLPFIGPLVALMRHTPELQRLEAAYLRVLCFSALPMLVTSSACSFFAGRGDSRTVLLVNAVSLAVNGPVAWVLIFGWGAIPALGIVGAGWATVAGTSASAVLSLVLVLRRKYRQEFGNGHNWGFDRELFVRLMRFGVPNGIGVALDVVAFAVFVALIGGLGEVELAATSITGTLNLLAFLPMMGVGQAVEVLVGQRLGEDRPDEAARFAWTGALVSFGLTALVAVAYLLLPETLTMPFRSSRDAARWAEVQGVVPVLLRFVALYCLFDSLNMVFQFALRGAGDTRFVTAVAVALAWPIMVLPTWASWAYGWGLYWAWGFASLYIILLALTLLLRFLQGKWRTMRVIEPAAGPGREVEEGEGLSEPFGLPATVGSEQG
jgi:MATE family multidrug resistance protein